MSLETHTAFTALMENIIHNRSKENWNRTFLEDSLEDDCLDFSLRTELLHCIVNRVYNVGSIFNKYLKILYYNNPYECTCLKEYKLLKGVVQDCIKCFHM